MQIQDLKKIIEEENLKGANICNATSLRPYQVVITHEDGQWKVYGTDERAGVYGMVSYFDSEEDACDDFIKKLRFRKREAELQKEIWEKRKNESPNPNLSKKEMDATTCSSIIWIICILIILVIGFVLKIN